MLCKQARQLIEADYLDGELGRNEKLEVEGHLADCAECRKLSEALRSQQAIFNKAKQFKVPEGVWQNIRENIFTEKMNQEKTQAQGFWEKLIPSLKLPRPVFSLAGAFVAAVFILLVTGNVIQNRQFRQSTASDTITRTYGISTENGSLLDDLGTHVEEYFL